MRHRFLTSLCCFSLFAPQVRAGFVLDDFDDPAEVASPEMENEFVTTDDVGRLSAVRNIGITSSRTDPNALLDSGTTKQSVLTAALRGHSPTATPAHIMSFQFNYEFAPTDVSENGSNTAILLEFFSVQGTELPRFVSVGVWDDSNPNTIFLNITTIPLIATTPFTAVMPFANFTTRTGAPALPDFTSFRRMDFNFFFLNPSEDIQWSAELDRIRFGRIPEPSCVSLVCAVLTICICGRTRFGVRFLVRGG